MTTRVIYHVVLIFALSFTGCTGMKNVSSADPLYTGSEIQFTGEEKKTKTLVPAIREVLKPSPNNTFLWMRPALARNNMLSEKRRKKKFWANKIAEPITLKHANPVQVSAAIQNRLFHQGYFHNAVSYDTILKGKRKAKYLYTIDLHTPYRFETITFPKPQNDLTQKIYDLKEASLLKKGQIYSLDDVKNERARIDRSLKEHGYLFFNPEFITIKADTVSGDHLVNAVLMVKPETPPESRKAYTIGRVFIHDDYLLDNIARDTVQQNNYFLISQNKALHFAALRRGVFLKPGELYTRSGHMQTIRYMNELPIIRNANVKYAPGLGADSLDVFLYLSQRKRYAYSAEFNAVFRSTNYFGPGMIISYTDRNNNKGSEMLKVNLRGRLEVQIVDGQVNPAYELGVELSYNLPRLVPDLKFNAGKKALPKTNISIGYNLFNRLDLYRLNSTYANFGYRWSRTDKLTHTFNPIEIIFTQIPEESKSAEFEEYLEENPGVQRSFDQQFITGASYEFTYQPSGIKSDEFLLRAGIDLSGNVLNGLYSVTNAEEDSLGRYTLFGVPFSQYVRSRLDLRYGFKFGVSKLITRFSAGLGIPLGNSDVVPYIKQFYVGGTNSLRSFVARSVGPGSEIPPGGYNDLTGDIRLEGNLEYRFNVAGSLKGALFMDAGNIWLYIEDPSRPNGTFHADTFLDEIAISSGWGLRWDFGFIVARLDFAYTLRTPYLPQGERWTTDLNIWKPALNIAIGYPF